MGTAIMMPLMMTTVMTIVPADQRGRTMGRVSIVMSVAPAIGPIVSGALIQILPWQGLFWVMLPIALVMLGIGIRRHVFNLQFQKGSADACRTDRAAFGGFFVLADIDQFDASLLLPSCLLDTDPRQGFP
jgi:MFS family permease